MYRFSFASIALCAAFLCSGTVQAQVTSNFRRGALDDKYRYSQRRIEQFDAFTTASGSTTFDRRAEYLRQTQLRRIQEDLDAREGGSGSRVRPYYLSPEGQPRFNNTILRRISEAKQQGGIRLRSNSRGLERMNRTSPEERQAQIEEYRNTIREAERNRGSTTSSNVADCFQYARRRLAMCLYEHTRN